MNVCTARLVTVLLVAALGIACAPVNYNQRMQAASVCCERYQDITFRPLEFGKPQRIEVGAENDSVRRFTEGATYFAAVALPMFRRPYELRIVSSPVGDQLFVPTVLLLDSNYHEIRRIEGDVFEYSNGILRHAFFVNDEHKRARYLIAYARKDRLGDARDAFNVAASTMPIMAGPYVFYYTHHQEVTASIWTAPGGRLEISAEEYAPRVIGDDASERD